MSLRVVLARPRIGENIGFVCRLCANFAIEAPTLVAPAADWKTRAAYTASMCRDVLDDVRAVGTLDDAVADCTQVFGLTARGGRERRLRPLSELSAGVGDPRKTNVALLFGNEESGLDSREARFCTRLYRAPLAGLTSLNLSHAVALALWETARHRDAPHENAPSRTTVADRERLRQRAAQVLANAGFRIEDSHLVGCLDRLVRGNALESRDARILHRLLSHIEWMTKR